MSVRDLCQNVRNQWAAFSRLVWPEDARQLTQKTLDRLTDDLARRYERLLARRRRIESARDRLIRLERRLQAQPESLALRASVLRCHDRLVTLEEGYAFRRQAFTRQKKLHQALLRGQIVACPDPIDVDPT